MGLFETPSTIQSMEFSWPEYRSGQPFPSPRDCPNPGIKTRSPTLQADSLPAEPQRKPEVIFLKITFKMYLLAVLGLHCHVGFSVTVEGRGYSLGAVHRFLSVVVSLVAEHRL